jgi:putative acetyltransferase
MNALSISLADSQEDLRYLRELFLEYARGLNFSLCFQNFDQELADLPGAYGPPEGRVLLARYQTEIAGCVALRKLGSGACEVKRLYVRPAFRGQRIGKKLAEAILEEAEKIGYSKVRLDTVVSMNAAIGLYKSLGFVRIEPYNSNPMESAVFMELALPRRAAGKG